MLTRTLHTTYVFMAFTTWTWFCFLLCLLRTRTFREAWHTFSYGSRWSTYQPETVQHHGRELKPLPAQARSITHRPRLPSQPTTALTQGRCFLYVGSPAIATDVGTKRRTCVGSRPSDHNFRSVCWLVCLFVQSFSQRSLIRFRSNLDICYMSGSSCVP